MALFGIVCLIVLIGAGVYYYFYTQGKINDRDGDYIPDEIEDTIEEVKETVEDVKEAVEDVIEEVQERVEAVTGELVDVKEAIKEVVDQAGDVVEAASKGKKRRGRPRKS
jgi:ABC-type transporter Mla subunit MlaD